MQDKAGRTAFSIGLRNNPRLLRRWNRKIVRYETGEHGRGSNHYTQRSLVSKKTQDTAIVQTTRSKTLRGKKRLGIFWHSGIYRTYFRGKKKPSKKVIFEWLGEKGFLLSLSAAPIYPEGCSEIDEIDLEGTEIKADIFDGCAEEAAKVAKRAREKTAVELCSKKKLSKTGDRNAYQLRRKESMPEDDSISRCSKLSQLWNSDLFQPNSGQASILMTYDDLAAEAADGNVALGEASSEAAPSSEITEKKKKKKKRSSVAAEIMHTEKLLAQCAAKLAA